MTCSAAACFGACCDSNGVCTLSPTAAACTGTFAGLHSACTATVCAGACCDAVSGGCVVSALSGCPEGTTYQSPGTACLSNPCPQPPPPSNDDCASAIGLCDGVPASGVTFGATVDGFGSCGASAASPDVWYTYVPATDGSVTVSLCGSSYDTTLGILDGPCGSGELGCDDDSTCGLQSMLTVDMTAGSTYTIRVTGFDGDTGAYNILVTGGGGQGCNGTTGVCCRGSTCNTSVGQAGCATGAGTAGAFFASSGSTCNSGSVSNSPCCYADYNKVGGVTVQDIFDFLNDWFAGSIYAKVGGNGASGGLSVQNIFDFLTNWFTGGCG